MCVSGPNKLHALTRGTHARTYMYTWLTEPLPDARQLPVARGRKKTDLHTLLLYTEVGIYMLVYPRLTLYTYMEILTPVEAEHKQAGRQGRPV